MSRRMFLKGMSTVGLLAMAGVQPVTLSGERIDLVIGGRSFTVDGQAGTAVTVKWWRRSTSPESRCRWRVRAGG